MLLVVGVFAGLGFMLLISLVIASLAVAHEDRAHSGKTILWDIEPADPNDLSQW